MADIELAPCEPGKLPPAELRTLFLFEKLTDDQLSWIAEHGCTQHVAAGQLVIEEGAPADQFFVLLSGTIALTRRVGQDDVQTIRTEQRGVYMGATQAYIRDEGVERKYMASMRALDDSDFFVLSAEDFGWMMREWFPMAIHLLEGLTLGMRNTQAAISERQRLVALGALSAGLMHELNNPAAAASRATGALRQRVAGMRHKLGMLAAGKVAPERLDALVELQEDVIERAAKAPTLTAMQAADREDELGDWMEEHQVTGGWDLAPVFAQGGLDIECLELIKTKVVEPGLLDQAIHWIGYALETEQLMSDIEDATGRVSSLVASAKQYSQLDRAAHQWIDVHTGLDSTLVMLGHKIGEGVKVVKLEDAIVNLAVNARDAMPKGGRLVIETANAHLDEAYATQNAEVVAGDYVAITVTDSGAGIAPNILERVFEPFFTTKEVGRGTGLGLSMVYGFVKQSRGHVKIYSEVDHGTTVRLYFPRAVQQQAPPLSDTSATAAPKLSGGRETILVVEDDASVRTMAVSTLEGLGYKVRQASEGKAALEILCKTGQIDLLFTDMIMPNGMNGQDLIGAARQVRPGITVLLTSGYSEEFIKTSDRAPDVPLLGKPYRREKLAMAVRAALDGTS